MHKKIESHDDDLFLVETNINHHNIIFGIVVYLLFDNFCQKDYSPLNTPLSRISIRCIKNND